MARAGIHPNYHKITIRMTDGTEYESRSTWGKEGDKMILDVDSLTHPAWVGGVSLRKTGQMEKFSNKFGFLGSGPGGTKTETEKTDDAAEAEAKKKKGEAA